LVVASAELDGMTAEELASDVAMEEDVVTSDAVAESEACPPGAAATCTISISLGTLRRPDAPDDEETDASELAAESRRLQDAARRIGAIAKDVPPGEGEEERGEGRGQQRPEPRPMDAGERKGRKGRSSKRWTRRWSPRSVSTRQSLPPSQCPVSRAEELGIVPALHVLF
jgi:hypothetical protein